jgi:Gram-negative bacterial TonB protein C-terminal
VARIALLVLLQGGALCQQGPAPESFRIGELNGGSWSITELQPVSETEIQARFIKIFPACGTFHVDEVDYIFEGVTVAQLAKDAALCAPEKRVANWVALAGGKSKGWGDGQIVEARCGSDLRIHHLPPSASLRFAALRTRAPEVAALFTLAAEVRSRYTRETEKQSPGVDPAWEEVRKQKRPLLEATAAEIRSGTYDLILPEFPLDQRQDGRRKISDAMPAPEEAAGFDYDAGEIDQPEQLGLEHIPRIPYPQMARVAHIEGDVKLDLAVEVPSGKVLSVVNSSGPPILRQAATDAINSSVFRHPYFGPNPVAVVVQFKVHCPVIVDTQSSTVARKPHRQKHKKTPRPKSRS